MSSNLLIAGSLILIGLVWVGAWIFRKIRRGEITVGFHTALLGLLAANPASAFRDEFCRPSDIQHGARLHLEFNMTGSPRIWPLLTGTIRYEKCISTRNRGHGQFIDAPILAYLIETPNGRILYDAGCDYRKLADPVLRAKYFDSYAPER